MTDNFKITMLGASGTGKTCFMIGMYNTMREGVRGFTFSTDWDVDKDFEQAWDRLIEGEGEERWPALSDSTKYYSFDFNFGFSKLAGFEWMDYRGGALGDRKDVKDLKELKEHLLESSAIFLCISGEYLATSAQKMSLSEKRRKALVTSMNGLLQELRREVSQPPPVVIVITKHDLCRDRPNKAVVHEVMELFNPLFVPNSGWLVMICPVTLGKQLAENLEGGQIVPQNIHLPVTFSVYCQFKAQMEREQAMAEGNRGRLKEYNKGFWSRMWHADEIDGLTEDLYENEAQFEDIENKMKLLGRDLLGEIDVYYSGREVKLDV